MTTEVNATAQEVTVGDGAGQEASHLRRLLLPPEHALRSAPRRALCHLPPSRAEPRPRAAAGVRLPDRAHARGLRVPAAELLIGGRRRSRRENPRSSGLGSAPFVLRCWG